MTDQTIYVITDRVDGETVLVAAFHDQDKAIAHRATMLREQARKAVAAGTADEGVDPEGDALELEDEFPTDLECSAVGLKDA
jgi:hypothetical protein